MQTLRILSLGLSTLLILAPAVKAQRKPGSGKGKPAVAKPAQKAPPKATTSDVSANIRATSDVRDAALKGNIMSIFVRKLPYTAPDAQPTSDAPAERLVAASLYDKNGRRSTVYAYYSAGQPRTTTFFEYGRPVTSRTMNWVLKDPADENSDSSLGPDEALHEYSFIYDKTGRLIDKAARIKGGPGEYRLAYAYEGNQIIETRLDGEGKQIDQTTMIVDEKRNVIRETTVSSDLPGGRITLLYHYETFDDKGNWTRRHVESGETASTIRIEKRKITYYD
jgi:hypothetical protein